jgi:CheY-like chemotaxis protein/HPt (histidine-containing phosphotransfer) domain-containing protein
LTTQQLEFTETTRGSADLLLAVINDILDYSKIEAGKLEIEIIDFDLRVTLEEVSDLVALKAHEEGLEFGCIVNQEISSLLCGDPGRLRQILINLVGNAIKFTDKGEVVIRVDLEEETAMHATVRFAVTDTGTGIPKDLMDRLFKSFSQVDASTTRKHGGTGLGLAISKQFAELMGGRIGVESKEGEGSTFWFTAVFEKQSEGKEKKVVIPEDIRGKRILIVDDNATNRHVLREQLKSWGCRYGEVPGGMHALEELRQASADEDPFEIAIIDMQMPGMDGEILGKEIKKDPDLKDTILVMLISLGERGDAGRLREIGFAAYLTKPVKQSQLYNCLATVTGMHKEEGNKVPVNVVTRHSLAQDQKQRVRILLAEDNIINQKVAINILKKYGYSADAVANGMEAVKVLEMIPYDIVLMDCQMPEMDGYEATREIRKIEDRRQNAGKTNSITKRATSNQQQASSIPIIALTANAMKGDREKCLEAGMDDYLSKPVKPQELLEKIEKWTMKVRDNSDQIEPVLDEGKPWEEKDESQPIDLGAALERSMGDKSFLEMLLGEFMKNLPVQIESLRAAVEKDDADALTKQAHTLKGSSANLSADIISAVALQLEQMGCNGDLGEVMPVLSELEAKAGCLKEFISRIEWDRLE